MAETGNFVPPNNVDSNVVNLLVKEMGEDKDEEEKSILEDAEEEESPAEERSAT